MVSQWRSSVNLHNWNTLEDHWKATGRPLEAHWKHTGYQQFLLQWHSSVHWGISSRHTDCHWIATGRPLAHGKGYDHDVYSNAQWFINCRDITNKILVVYHKWLLNFVGTKREINQTILIFQSVYGVLDTFILLYIFSRFIHFVWSYSIDVVSTFSIYYIFEIWILKCHWKPEKPQWLRN